MRMLCLLLLATGCTPRLAPLYHDFTAPMPDSVSLEAARRALMDAGWQLAEAPASGTLTTTPRRLQSWGIYQVYLSVEVLPLGGPYVRVLFHPYRKYLTGGRGKIPYLPAGVRRTALPPIQEAFEAEGFHVVLSGERAYRAARNGTE